MADCDICKDESGGEYVGIAAVPGAPVSLGWCSSCLRNNAVPRHVVEFWLFSEFEQSAEFAEVPLEMPEEPPEEPILAPWAMEMTLWLDGQYVMIRDALPQLWREEYERSDRERV